jgi:hypothetical protein
MAKRKWRASCKLIKIMKNLQNTRHSDLIIYNSYATYVMPLMFYQALEESGGFLIIDQLQLAWI